MNLCPPEKSPLRQRCGKFVEICGKCVENFGSHPVLCAGEPPKNFRGFRGNFASFQGFPVKLCIRTGLSLIYLN